MSPADEIRSEIRRLRAEMQNHTRALYQHKRVQSSDALDAQRILDNQQQIDALAAQLEKIEAAEKAKS